MRLTPLVLLAIILVACDSDADHDGLPPTATCEILVTWSAPSTRLDGTPITLKELEKYTIYVNLRESTDDSTLVMIADITDTTIESWLLKYVHKGRVYIYLTVTDTEGRISPYSNMLDIVC